MTKSIRSGFLVALLATCVFAAQIVPGYAATSGRSGSTSSMGVSKPSPSFAPSSPAPRASAPVSPPSPTSGLGVSKPGMTTTAAPAAILPSAPAPSPTVGLGVSKPGAPPAATAASKPPVPSSQTAGLGVSKPGSPQSINTPPPGNRTPPGILATASTKQMSATSLKQLDADKARATAPAQPVNVAAARSDPVFASARTTYGGDTARYYSDRTSQMGSWRSTHVIYVHDMRPNYGIYDVIFLATLMEASNYNWAYSHRNDPWYSQWHADQMRQAADNEQLRNQMAAMDAKVAELEREKAAPMAANALPPGVSPAIAIAPETMSADENDAPSSTFFSFGHVVILIILLGGISFGLIYFLKRRAA